MLKLVDKETLLKEREEKTKVRKRRRRKRLLSKLQKLDTSEGALCSSPLLISNIKSICNFLFLLSQIEEEKKKKKEEAARKKQEQEVDHMFPRSDVSSSSSVSQTMNTFTHSLLLLFRWLNWRR